MEAAKRKRLSFEITVLLLFTCFYIICRILNITCLFYAFTKTPCPTCYMGRALVFLLKGNFKGYITYNVMALPVLVVFVTELFNKYFAKYKKVIRIHSVTVLVFNMSYYLFRMIRVF